MPRTAGYPEPRVRMLTRHEIESLVARIEPDLIALRRRIHQHPELAFMFKIVKIAK